MAVKRVRVSAERQWAMDEGYELNPKGPLPAHIHEAWLEFNSTSEDEESGHSVSHSPDDGESSSYADEPETLTQDPEPKRVVEKNIMKASRKTVKVTPTIRKDIKAKIALMLTLPAGILARRDPICGPVLLQQTPEISDALVDIICDSPDLVQFFTAGGSGYMKWLGLAVAFQPVATVAFQHHVAHSIGVSEEGNPAQEDWSQYAAPEFA
jgi:hypothetical protein